jgi:alpha-L-fucosidase
MTNIRRIALLFAAISFFNTAKSQDLVVNDKASSYNLNKPERELWFKNNAQGLFVHFGLDAQTGLVISHSLVGSSDDYADRFFNDLPKTFDPEKIDFHEIALLAKNAGMKYIMFTTKHHAGFCMWDTKTTDFKITKTPYKRDMLKEFVTATREVGLEVGFYYSPEDFYFLHTHNVPITRDNPKIDAATRKAYDDYTREQCKELMTKYGKVDLLFIDGEPTNVVKEICWKLQPDIIITRGVLEAPEQIMPGTKNDQPWLSCITMGTAWGYQPNDRYKSGTELIKLLIEARAKGGSLLLNVGPRATGELAEAQQDRLLEIAGWYSINQEAVENTRSWSVVKEDNIWFTSKDNGKTLYAIVTDDRAWRNGQRKTFVLHSVKATANTKVGILGQNSTLVEYRPTTDASSKFQQTADGLEVSVVKAQRIYDDNTWPNPVVIKLENIESVIDDAVLVQTGMARANAEGALIRSTLRNFQDKGVKRGRVDYRVSTPASENAAPAKWIHSDWTEIKADGSFEVQLKDLKEGIYEYRAVADQSKVDVEGSSRVLRK